MCTNGINTGQFEQMIEQIDDHIKLERRWAHNLGIWREMPASPPFPRRCMPPRHAGRRARAARRGQGCLEDDAEASANVTVNLV